MTYDAYRGTTDPEALDAAIRLAGEVRWYNDGIDNYDQIVSTFEACFDSTGNLYPGSRDRAYYAGRAMAWIHTLVEHKSWELALMFPRPNAQYRASGLDPDLEMLDRKSVV